ncbi:MAG TPA: ABC transporter ATP-binding protein [Acidimicrobiales bacterium]|jgi:ABC-2 type transport system ATP-binding protein
MAPSNSPAIDVPAVDVTGLVVRYGTQVAVAGVDLQAARGEVVCVLGRNGAGKTSTVEALEGYRRPAAGTIRVLGLDPQRPDDHRALTRRVGVMLQRGGVYPGMAPAEAIRLFATYYPHPEDPRALLDRMGLTGAVARTPWRRLSGGEQQRLSLALALIGRPEVVFMDEPTAGVDPQGRLSIRGVITDLRAAGVCVLLTTHELEEAERLADRIVIIDHGRVVAAGSPAELTRAGGTPDRPESPADIRFGAPPALDTAALSQRLGAVVIELRPGEYRVDAPGSPATVADLTAWLAEHDVPLADLRAGRQRLEDVFLRLTDHGQSAGDTGGASNQDEVRR